MVPSLRCSRLWRLFICKLFQHVGRVELSEMRWLFESRHDLYVELLLYEDNVLWFISIDDNILLKGIYYESLNLKRIWLILQRSFVSHVVIRQVERYVQYPHSLHSNKLYLDCRTITFLMSRSSLTTGLIYSTCKNASFTIQTHLLNCNTLINHHNCIAFPELITRTTLVGKCFRVSSFQNIESKFQQILFIFTAYFWTLYFQESKILTLHGTVL